MFTAKNTVISSNFLMWTFRGETQFPHRNCAFPQNFDNRKLGEITVFCTVVVCFFVLDCLSELS